MKAGLRHYIRAAFGARPMGMIVPPNWVGLAAFALLGLLNPGFWAIGAGLELAYLVVVSTNRRFQERVGRSATRDEVEQSPANMREMIGKLLPPARQRYESLERRCRVILAQQHLGPDASRHLQLQGDGLGRVQWLYLRLLASRQAFEALLRESMRADSAASGGEPIERRVERLQRTLKDPPEEPEDLRRSLTSQLQILEQRLESQRDAREKLAFLDAELTRIEQQVELIREQAVVSTDPAAVSQRIEDVAAELGETSQWVRDQEQLYGGGEVLAAPPALRA